VRLLVDQLTARGAAKPQKPRPKRG